MPACLISSTTDRSPTLLKRAGTLCWRHPDAATSPFSALRSFTQFLNTKRTPRSMAEALRVWHRLRASVHRRRLQSAGSVARILRQCLWDHSYMENTLADFPPDRFAITAHCPCGHSMQVDYRLLPCDTRVNSLRFRLVCSFCGRRHPGIRIQWVAAGGFRYG